MAAGEEKRKAGLSDGKPKKRVSSVSSERGSKSPLKRTYEQSPRKRGRPPKDEKVCVWHLLPTSCELPRAECKLVS